MSIPIVGRRVGFPFILATSAVLIAGCSAYFSVLGLGLLFASSIPVMIMAATLEIGKLVAASFLYRYWQAIQTSLKFYLTTALLVLIGITSLGNYGYLARAYEKTNDEIFLTENQITQLEVEAADLQARIDVARTQSTQTQGASREDAVRLQQRVAQEKEALDQALARIESARNAANARRTNDAKAASDRASEQGTALAKSVAGDEATIAGLIKRLEVLDRAVDAYTAQGTTGLIFKTDGIKLGQELRAEQAEERAAIATDLERARARFERVREEQLKLATTSSAEIRSIDERLRDELRQLDSEAAEARKSSAAAVLTLEQQLGALQEQLDSRSASGETRVEVLASQLRERTLQIQALKDRIQGSDIGTYRFIARAFDTTADVVVKWLIFAIVMVFDPLAVTLVIAFNVALLREANKDTTFVAGGNPASASASRRAQPASVLRGWVGILLAVLSTLLVGLSVWAFWPTGKPLVGQSGREHFQLVPGDSFAVAAFRPARPTVDLRANTEDAPEAAPLVRTTPDPVLKAVLGEVGGQIATQALQDLAAGPLDPEAAVIVFAKHPTRQPGEDGETPVMLCGVVVRITDRAAAEASLARLAEQMRTVLRPEGTNPVALTRNRAMVRHAGGRFLDPEGGFFTFGVTDTSAILMIELGGDPLAPTIGAEMRRCLSLAAGQDQSQESLPPGAFGSEIGVSLWLDVERFFRRLPMGDATQARYEELRAAVNYELRLSVRLTGPDQVGILARYDYRQGRQPRLNLKPGESILGTIPEDDAARLLRGATELLDLDVLAERFREVLGTEGTKVGVRQVLVEKSDTSNRSSQFLLTARLEDQSEQPLAGVLLTLFR